MTMRGLALPGVASALSALWDYGNKAWAGLTKGYYDRRYQIYAAVKICTLEPTAGAPRIAAALCVENPRLASWCGCRGLRRWEATAVQRPVE